MRILSQDYPSVKLVPETPEDLWYLEKVIDPGDIVEGISFRRFKAETSSEKKKIFVKLKVEKVSLQKHANTLRVLGIIIEGRPEEFVSLGSHHTLDISLGHSIKLTKSRWLDYHKKMLEKAVASSKRPKLVLVALDDEQATIAVLSETGLDIKAEIERKGGGKQYPDESIMKKYFHEVCKKLSEFDVPSILLGGPGFTKENIYAFCQESYPELAKKIILADVRSPGRAGIQEMLSRPELLGLLKENRIAYETGLVNKLLEEVSKGGLAVYGLDQVKEALEFGAVEELLIPESFFLNNRDACEELMEKAENVRAKIHVISEDHDAGKQLKAIGVSAILRFKI